MNNSVDKNAVIAFSRAVDGTLRETGQFATGGRGSGGNTDPLESQGSVAQRGNLVYVLNVGGSSNVVGFTLNNGKLTEIPTSTRFPTTNDSEAASLSFSPDGSFLVVTERATNKLDVFAVESDGTLSPIVVTPSVGPGAFSVSFAPNGAAILPNDVPTLTLLCHPERSGPTFSSPPVVCRP